MTGKQRSRAIPVMLLTIGMVTMGGRVSLAQDATSGVAASPDVYSQDDLMGMEKKLKEKVDDQEVCHGLLDVGVSHAKRKSRAAREVR